MLNADTWCLLCLLGVHTYVYIKVCLYCFVKYGKFKKDTQFYKKLVISQKWIIFK